MKSQDADRLIVAFAALLNAQRVLIVGSQALHGTHPDPPIAVVEASREVDIVPLPFEEYERWFYYAHERLGADSEFDVEHGIYVDMVRDRVPKLPPGWESRSIERALQIDDSRSVTAVYPELHDLLVSKLLANRAQDEAFLRGVTKLGRIDPFVLRERLLSVPLPEEKEPLRGWAFAAVGRCFGLEA